MARNQNYIPGQYHEEQLRRDPIATYHPAFSQPQPPINASHYQSNWHLYMQHAVQPDTTQFGTTQVQATQNLNPQFHLDQRTAIMLRVTPPPKVQENPTQQSHESKLPQNDVESW
jgi:hypothetical protein